eukprot:7561873-Pyramimonas_sp.AAC.1
MPASCSHLVRASHGLVYMPRTWSTGRSKGMQRGARHSHMALQLPGSRCVLASLWGPSAMSCASRAAEGAAVDAVLPSSSSGFV